MGQHRDGKLFRGFPASLEEIVRTGIGVGLLALSLMFTDASLSRAYADSPHLDQNDIATAFSIRRSLNRNRVDYGVRLDERCQAVGRSPVVPYWRLLSADSRVEMLLRREEPAYGIASQSVRDVADGSVIEVRLRALSDRPVSIRTRRAADGCHAETRVRIAGAEARLGDIYVVIDGQIRVDHIVLRGRSVESGREVTETLRH